MRLLISVILLGSFLLGTTTSALAIDPRLKEKFHKDLIYVTLKSKDDIWELRSKYKNIDFAIYEGPVFTQLESPQIKIIKDWIASGGRLWLRLFDASGGGCSKEVLSYIASFLNLRAATVENLKNINPLKKIKRLCIILYPQELST